MITIHTIAAFTIIKTKKISKMNYIVMIASIVRRVRMRTRMRKRKIGMLTMMRKVTTRKMKKTFKVTILIS